jgi:O-acetyl-ADP-ribose deacetylase (regulator of RNase III)
MKYVKGSLLDASETYIAHGCNAQGVMGSGVALLIKDKYPKAYEDYKQFVRPRNHMLGSYVPSLQHDGKIILNLITQEFYGRDGRVYASTEHIRNSLVEFVCDNMPLVEVAIPKIGCGLGGLKWPNVEKVLLSLEEDYKIRFTVYEG